MGKDSDLQKVLKKACSVEEVAPKRKHVRACIVYTWDHQSSKEFFGILKSMPFVNDEVQLFKSLIVLHKVIQEGHPSALVQAVREREWIRSLARTHFESSSYSKLIREYVRYLITKLDFHRSHKSFKSGTFEYEEYVSLTSVADLDQGYETILDMMNLQDSLDQYGQVIFASMDRANRQNECKIAALIPLVEEAYGIYKFVTSMLRAVHKQMDDAEGDEVLQPLKEKYEAQHVRLFEFFADCASIKFLTSLVTIPKLPLQPPDVYLDPNGSSTPTIARKSVTPESKKISPQVTNRSRANSRLSTPTPLRQPSSSSAIMTPSYTAASTITNAANLIPTVTGAMAQAFSAQQQPQIQPDFWNLQQQQFADEQRVLEQERQQQLLQQQQQQLEFEKQMQQAQAEMMQMNMQQQTQHENDLIALNTQHQRDQSLLEQYDQRVNQLETEITQMTETANKQLQNKDEMNASLQDQLKVWETKYESLSKLYSQLRQEHLQLLPKFKKLQLKVNSAQESILKKEQLEGKLKRKDLQMVDLIKERDRLKLEIDRQGSRINEANMSLETLQAMMDAVLTSGISTIQEAVYLVDSPIISGASLVTPLQTIIPLIESTAEKATDFATNFNDLIVDGLAKGDQTAVIFGVSDFSNSVATLIITTKSSLGSTVMQNDETVDEITRNLKKCAREAEYFLEDLISDNLNNHTEEEKTDIVINANVDFQEKLQELQLMLEPYMNLKKPENLDFNAHTELVTTAQTLQQTSQPLRVEQDVPQPILSLSLAIVDAVLALIQAAILTQNEIESSTKIPLKQFYRRNSRWTEGLVSAAKAVGNSSNGLISVAKKLLTSSSEGSLEEFVVVAKNVAASTVQLVAASRVKAVPHSKSQNQLEESSRAVTQACKALGTHIMGSLENSPNNIKASVDFTTEHTMKTVEMEQQISILKLEQSLANARKRLGEIRKRGYELGLVEVE